MTSKYVLQLSLYCDSQVEFSFLSNRREITQNWIKLFISNHIYLCSKRERGSGLWLEIFRICCCCFYLKDQFFFLHPFYFVYATLYLFYFVTSLPLLWRFLILLRTIFSFLNTSYLSSVSASLLSFQLFPCALLFLMISFLIMVTCI